MAEDIKHYLYGEKIVAKPIARYKSFFRNKKIYFFVAFSSIIFIFLVIFIVVSTKYYYTTQEKKQQKVLKFKKFKENLTNKNFTVAFKHLASLRNNSAELNKINEQLQQLSQQYSSQGLANLFKYKNTSEQLQLQYDTKYQKLMNSSPNEQEKKLCELQNIMTQQMAIKIELGNAFANFWCSILCDPTNFFAYDNFQKIYLQKIQELDSQYNFHWDTIVLDILHNASNSNSLSSVVKKNFN
jgi:Tfp pilus assembly protein PilO